MLQVRNITKFYGEKKALDNVSFEVDSGEVVGLLGPNGAGKTTTLNIITGVLFPSEGQVLVDGVKLDDDEYVIKKKIGYLSENNPLYTDLLVRESLKMAAEFKGLRGQEYKKNFDRVVDIVGLSDVLNQNIESLSKGYKQRVGLAQALISNPPILILDEPTEGLDPNQRQEIRDLIQKLGSEYTVLLSTHIMQEVEAICKRVIILNEGKIATTGTVSEVTQAQEDYLELELGLSGNKANQVKSVVEDSFDIEDGFRQGDLDIMVVKLKNDQLEDFYQLVSDSSSNQAYVTHLQVRREKLEDVFRKVTTK